jgi:hypothetical protein
VEYNPKKYKDPLEIAGFLPLLWKGVIRFNKSKWYYMNKIPLAHNVTNMFGILK